MLNPILHFVRDGNIDILIIKRKKITDKEAIKEALLELNFQRIK